MHNAIHYLLLVWFKICDEKLSIHMVTETKYDILFVAYCLYILESWHETI